MARKQKAADGRQIWTGGALAVLADGPRAGAWYRTVDLERMRAEAVAFGRTPDDSPLLCYRKTSRTVDHPTLCAGGTAWHYNPLPRPL